MIAKAINTYTEKPRRVFWLSVQLTRLAQAFPGRAQRRALSQSSAGTKEKQFSEDWHFSDGNE